MTPGFKWVSRSALPEYDYTAWHLTKRIPNSQRIEGAVSIFIGHNEEELTREQLGQYVITASMYIRAKDDTVAEWIFSVEEVKPTKKLALKRAEFYRKRIEKKSMKFLS